MLYYEAVTDSSPVDLTDPAQVLTAKDTTHRHYTWIHWCTVYTRQLRQAYPGLQIKEIRDLLHSVIGSSCRDVPSLYRYLNDRSTREELRNRSQAALARGFEPERITSSSCSRCTSYREMCWLSTDGTDKVLAPTVDVWGPELPYEFETCFEGPRVPIRPSLSEFNRFMVVYSRLTEAAKETLFSLHYGRFDKRAPNVGLSAMRVFKRQCDPGSITTAESVYGSSFDGLTQDVYIYLRDLCVDTEVEPPPREDPLFATEARETWSGAFVSTRQYNKHLEALVTIVSQGGFVHDSSQLVTCYFFAYPAFSIRTLFAV